MKALSAKKELFLISGLACAYAGALAWMSRAITVEKRDGVEAIQNGLALFGVDGGLFKFNLTRPPAGWVLLSPFAAAGYARGGAAGALAVTHAVMPFFFALLLVACYEPLRRLHGRALAAALVVLLAINPVAVSFAPFAMFDVFSAAAALPFLWAAYRYLEKPGRAALGWTFAAYVLAVLSRYQFAALILVPFAAAALEGRVKKDVLPLFLLPPAAYAACALLMALPLAALGRLGLSEALALAHRDMSYLITMNLGQQAVPWPYYFLSLYRQLGPLCLALAAGLWVWLRGSRPGGRYLAAALLVPFLLMSFAAPWKEERYIIQLLPLVYAAVGEGLALLTRRAPAAAAAAMALALAPWGQSFVAWRVVASEPTMRTTAHWKLARVLAEGTAPDGSICWSGGQAIFFDHLELAPQGVDILMLGSEILEFYAGRRVGGDECGPLLFDVTGKPGGEKLGTVYRLEGGKRRSLYELYPFELRETRRRGGA